MSTRERSPTPILSEVHRRAAEPLFKGWATEIWLFTTLIMQHDKAIIDRSLTPGEREFMHALSTLTEDWLEEIEQQEKRGQAQAQPARRTTNRKARQTPQPE